MELSIPQVISLAINVIVLGILVPMARVVFALGRREQQIADHLAQHDKEIAGHDSNINDLYAKHERNFGDIQKMKGALNVNGNS